MAIKSLKEAANRMKEETENLLELLKRSKLDKPKKIGSGSRINMDMEMEIIGNFFHEDVKYGIVLPVVLEKYMDIPGIIKIENDEWSVEFSGNQYNKDMETDIIKKSMNIYMNFRKENNNKFMKNSLGQ